MKVVVTMTSWKKRLYCIPKMIDYFFNTQTVKPDLFYLWLAIPEFPNKEKDLPKEVLNVIKKHNIILRWTEENYKGFKRWFVYPEHYNDIVVSIDDDIYFDKDLIKIARNFMFPSKTTITLFKSFSLEIVNGYIYKQNYTTKPILNRKFLCCSILPPKTFPIEVLNEPNMKLLKEIGYNYDEPFLLPFFIKNGVSRTYYNFNNKFDNAISSSDSNFSCISNNIKITNSLTLSKTFFAIYIILRSNSELYESWNKLFKNYDNIVGKYVSKYTTNELISMLKK